MLFRNFFFVCILFGITSILHSSVWAAVTVSYKVIADTSQIGRLIKEADRHLWKEVFKDKDADSVQKILEQATVLSNESELRDFRYRTLTLRATLLLKRGAYPAADELFNQVADYYHVTDKVKEAQMWEYYSNHIPYDDLKHASIRMKGYQNSYELYKKLGNRIRTADALGKIADVELNLGNYNSAETKMLTVLKEYKALKYIRIYYGYYILAEIYNRKGQFQKQIVAQIQCLTSFEEDPNGSAYDGALFTINLGNAYYSNQNYQNALESYIRAGQMALKAENRLFYYVAVNAMTKCLINLKQPYKAIPILKTAYQKLPPESVDDKAILMSTEIRIYNTLRDSAKAASIIPRLNLVFDQLYQKMRSSENYHASTLFLYNFETIPSYYIQTGKWDRLSVFVQKIKVLRSASTPISTRLKLLEWEYKADSAGGDLNAALRKYQIITSIRDSLSSAANAREVTELEARYESVKKDKTIQSLNNKSLVQNSRIEKIHMQRNATFAGIFISLLFACFMVLAYRGKQRSNLKLRSQQSEINTQNEKLSGLIQEKETLLDKQDLLLVKQDDLIAEKEWLLKEIHHRVKNNLQIIMSLLYTQSAYLENPDAAEAIKDTQNRVQAISIIHQKLYSKESSSGILASEYVTDLSGYLSNFFNAEQRKIRFSVIVAPITIDISQAVPIGLIINEAVTNSMKYAFNEQGGKITIELHQINQNQISLIISDDGIGLPEDFSLEDTTSLGMEMMKALSKQLGGKFEIENQDGITIKTRFTLVDKHRQAFG